MMHSRDSAGRLIDSVVPAHAAIEARKKILGAFAVGSLSPVRAESFPGAYFLQKK